jgi:glutathione S-transferase
LHLITARVQFWINMNGYVWAAAGDRQALGIGSKCYRFINRETMMIKLYGYGPAWGLPDCSVFVTKVDCYLRMVDLPYTPVPWRSFHDLQNAPKGKFPYIEDNGKKIADSGFIIEYLRATYGDKLGESKLTAQQRAIAHSMRRMIEEHLYWPTVYAQWEEDPAWEVYKPVILGPLPASERQSAEVQFRDIIRGYLHAQGVGRHSRAEVYELGNADLSALSAYLEEKPYVMGAQPTSLDATAYAFLTRILWVPYESPLKAHMQTLPNLVGYCQRMRERYYPDKAKK